VDFQVDTDLSEKYNASIFSTALLPRIPTLAAVISLSSINSFVTENYYVFFEVGTKVLSITKMNFVFRSVKMCYSSLLTQLSWFTFVITITCNAAGAQMVHVTQ
jgi:hypothetical protein